MTLKKSIQTRLVRIKVRINWLLDRIMGFCDFVLMDVYPVPFSWFRNLINRLVRVLGDFCLLLRDFPRMSAYRIAGHDFSIVFIGSREGLREIIAILCAQEKVPPENLGRIKIPGLKRIVATWLESGIHLVVWESSRLFRRSIAFVDFSVPLWVQQVVDIPETFESLFEGNARRYIRVRINRARRGGFGHRFTRADVDFDIFYKNMYLPYLEARHGDRALISPQEDQRRLWLRNGGLILATHQGVPVAGMLSYMARGTFFVGEFGVVPDDPDLLHKQINTFLYLSAMERASSHRCRIFDMGGSHGYVSNGIFSYKNKWGARVVRRRRICPVWRFLAKDIPEPLRILMNGLGLICENEDGFWRVFIPEKDADSETPDLKAALMEAKKAGLSGAAVVAGGRKTYFPCGE